jgi:hypothetical protein
LTAPSYRNNDLCAIPPGLHQLRQNFRRILEVAIHDDRGIASRRQKTGGDRPHVSPVAGKLYDHYVRVGSLQSAQYFQG